MNLNWRRMNFNFLFFIGNHHSNQLTIQFIKSWKGSIINEWWTIHSLIFSCRENQFNKWICQQSFVHWIQENKSITNWNELKNELQFTCFPFINWTREINQINFKVVIRLMLIEQCFWGTYNELDKVQLNNCLSNDFNMKSNH